MPSRVITVAAPRRQREGPDDSVKTDCLKEWSGFDLANDLVLLTGREGGEARRSSDFGLRPPIQIGNAVCVRLSLRSIERRERAIDEVDSPSLGGSRPTVDSGKDPRREGGNGLRLGRRQCARLGGDVLRRRLLTGEGKCIFDVEQVSGRPGCTGSHGSLEEGSSSVKIGHAALYLGPAKPDPTRIYTGRRIFADKVPRGH